MRDDRKPARPDRNALGAAELAAAGEGRDARVLESHDAHRLLGLTLAFANLVVGVISAVFANMAVAEQVLFLRKPYRGARRGSR
jgi:hypothetical protein